MTYPDFLARWSDPTDKELAALHSVKAVRALTGLSQRAFAETYGLPRRTIENWESSNEAVHNEIAPYTLALLAYAVLNK